MTAGAGLWGARALVAFGACVGLWFLAGWFGAAWWVLDLAAHFRVLQTAGLLAAALGLLLLRRPRWCLLYLGLAALAGSGLLPYWFGGAAPGPGGRPLRVASLNVLCGNRDTERIRSFVRTSAADVLLLIEVDRPTLDALAPDLRRFERRIERPRPDPFGMALYARIPLEVEPLPDFGSFGLPSIAARLDVGGTQVRLACVHAPPPVTERSALERDSVIAAAVEALCAGAEPGILLGDLNTTPWGESLARLAFPRGLRDARRGQGLLPSWPADSPLLRIPIDHCLVRGPWRVQGAHLGDACGSDHLGLVVDLALDP